MAENCREGKGDCRRCSSAGPAERLSAHKGSPALLCLMEDRREPALRLFSCSERNRHFFRGAFVAAGPGVPRRRSCSVLSLTQVLSHEKTNVKQSFKMERVTRQAYVGNLYVRKW